MNDKITFGRFEATALLVNAVCVQIFLDFPRAMAQEGATAGWILVLYNAVLVFIIFSLISKLFSRFEGKDLLDISESIGGRATRMVTGIFIMAYFIFSISLVLREFGEGMKLIALPKTSLHFIILLILLGIVGSAYFGLESIVRFHAVVVPLIIAGLLILIIGAAPYYEFGNLHPMLGTGAFSIFFKGFHRICTFSALIILFTIAPFIKTYKNLKIAGYSSVAIAAVLLVTSVAIFLAVMPYPASAQSVVPIYQMARLISFPRILERIESVFIVIWGAAVLLFISTGFYLLVYMFGKTFRLIYFRPLIMPFGIIIFYISMLPKSYIRVIHVSTAYFSHFAWITAFGIPILLLCANIMTKTKKGAM